VRLLSRHLLASYLGFFIAILLASMIAIAIIEMLLNFDDIVERGRGIHSVATYMLLRLPSYYLHDLIPASSFGAAFLCFGLLARRREITAMKAAGISPLRAGLSVLAAAATLSACALIADETFVLDTTREWNRGGDATQALSFHSGSFWYHRGDFIYNVREADREAGSLHGVHVFERNSRGRLVRSIRAELVRIEEGHRWRFVDATLRSFDPSDPAAPPRLDFASEKVLDVAEERDLALLDASTRTLSLPDLSQYIEARTQEGRDTTRYRALLHARLAHPFSVLLFAALAIPLGLAVEQSRSLAAGALHGIVITGLFFTLRSIASMLGAAGFAAATLSPWFLLTSFAGYGAWRFTCVSR
jgi:LPS export ABC transporter permease LptG